MYSSLICFDIADQSPIQDSAFCAMLDNPRGFPLWELSTCIFFVVPMLVIMVLYIRMGLQIRSRTRHTAALGVQQGSMHGESRQSQSRKAIIRMLGEFKVNVSYKSDKFEISLLYPFCEQQYN